MIASSFEVAIAPWIEAEGMQAPLLVVAQDKHVLEAAATFAAQFTACQKEEGKPCKECAGCKQALAGTYPDIYVLQHEKATVTVKEVRAMLDFTTRQAFQARRLIVIPHAERVSGAAAAALLKTLEEPAITTRFLLTTSHPRRMLATLLSRSSVVKLAPTVSQVAPTDISLPRLKDAPEALSEDELTFIAYSLEKQLKEAGNSPALIRAYMRLKDYYKIRSRRGNEKLAAGVLLATLEEVRPKP